MDTGCFPAQPSRWRRWFKCLGWCAVLLTTLVVLFYPVENWRGRRAWQACRRELEAKGERLDFASLVPPPVPDELNFAKTPLLTNVGLYYKRLADRNTRGNWTVMSGQPNHPAWTHLTEFGRSGLPIIISSGAPQLTDFQAGLERLHKQGLVPDSLETQEPAAAVLAYLEKILGAEMNELRAASRRHYGQFPVDTKDPFDGPIPNFVLARQLAQAIFLAATAELSLGHPEAAFTNLLVLHRLTDAVASHPMLVSAMVGVAIRGLEVQAFWEGWATRRWPPEQLTELQQLFAQPNLLRDFDRALRAERAAQTQMLENSSPAKLEELFSAAALTGTVTAWPVLNQARVVPRDWFQQIQQILGDYSRAMQKLIQSGFQSGYEVLVRTAVRAAPSGWVLQNLAAYNSKMQFLLAAYDVPQLLVRPTEVERNLQTLTNSRPWFHPYTVIAAIAIPNISRAIPVVYQNQSMLRLTVVVCALERYRLAHGQFPETLDALVPQYLAKLPHDLIGGGPLHYQRSADGRFQLYSVGWNGVDDGGVTAWQDAEQTSPDFTKGDWGWLQPE